MDKKLKEKILRMAERLKDNAEDGHIGNLSSYKSLLQEEIRFIDAKLDLIKKDKKMK